jgi:cell division protein ZapA
MTLAVNGTSIDVLGKVYQIKCPDQELPALQKAAEYLEEKMVQIKACNNVLSVDRIAVLAALNITHQLLTLEYEKTLQIQRLEKSLQQLHRKLEEALRDDPSNID